jgi:hypothetical protein
VIDPLADEPEPLEGDRIDLGEIVAEELALAIDPYPRAPGAELAAAAPAAGDTEPVPGPPNGAGNGAAAGIGRGARS